MEFNFVIGKLKHSITRQRKNDSADIILKEKVEFAKRLFTKGFSEEEITELSGISNKELKRLNELRNQIL